MRVRTAFVLCTLACWASLRLPYPAIAANIPPAAVLDHTEFLATGTHQAVLTVAMFGRYSITVASAQGTALQLVDRMAGPGDVQGTPGARDGRIDAFLERGTYKIRLISDARGSGAAVLTVTPFTELQAAPVQLVEDRPVIAPLGDDEQRSWWIIVPVRGTYSFEAGGRYLSDLRLWQPGSWMVDATPVVAESDAIPSEPLGLRQLTAQLEPGVYRLTAYGGTGLLWPSGSAAAPFMLRWGVPSLSDSGRGVHQASLLGIDRFLVPGTATLLRLVIDHAEPAQVSAQPYNPTSMFDPSSAVSAAISKTSRDPVAALPLSAPDPAVPWLVTVNRTPGARYRLEVLNASGGGVTPVPGNGDEMLAVTLPGNPDDEIDAGFFLVHDGERMEASSAIDLDTALPWRRRFNLLAPAQTFLFTSDAVALRIDGAGANANFVVQRFLTYTPPDLHIPYPKPSGGVWQLTPGYYVLTASPLLNRRGILTMSMYASGGAPPHADSPRLTAALFPDISPDPFHPDALYTSLPDSASFGLRLEPLPITLAQPLSFEIGAGQTQTFAIAPDEDGQLAVSYESGAAAAFTLDGKPLSGTVMLTAGQYQFGMTGPATGTQVVTLTQTPVRLLPATALPALPLAQTDPTALPPVLPGQPSFIDLAQGQNEHFALPVGHDALYQFQTTGLLETGGAIRTRVNPSLATAEGNGVGRNFLLQPFLREGDYQLAVTAQGQTAGHLGVSVSETKLLDEGVLTPGLAARITLEPGQAAAYRFHIDVAGTYHVFTLGLGHQFSMRLEDGDGWPLITPGGAADATLDLAAGDYRMILLPGLVENRAVTMLQRVLPPVSYQGHGPFAVDFGAVMANRWMEPAAGQARTPDVWRFALPAAATVTVGIDSGMRADIDGAGGVAAGSTAGGAWTGTLAAGAYTIAAVHGAPDSRVDYTLRVDLKELVSGQSRDVAAPASVPVSLGGGDVEISSFGDQDVRASLFDAAGRQVAANDDRPNDWNFLIAGRFPAGNYTLKVDPVGADNAQTNVSVSTPVSVDDPALRPGASARIADGLTHVMAVPAAVQGGLLLVGAAAPVPVGLVLEGQTSGQDWRQLAQTSGVNPYLAMPAGTSGEIYRLRVWTEDHGATPVVVTADSVNGPDADAAALPGGVDLHAVTLGTQRIWVSGVTLAQAQVLQLQDASGTLEWSAAGDQAATHDPSGVMVVPGRFLWLADQAAGSVTARPVDLLRETARLNLGAGQRLDLPVAAAGSGEMALWQVLGLGGQPGVAVDDGSAGSPVMAFGARLGAQTAAAAFQPAGLDHPVLHLWQAGVVLDQLPLTVRRIGFAAPVAIRIRIGSNDGRIGAGAAVQARFGGGWKLVSLNLPAGMAAVFSRAGRVRQLVVGNGVMPDVLESDGDALTLLNPGAAAAVFSVSVQAIDHPALVLGPGGLLTRYSATPAILHVAINDGTAMPVRIAGAAQSLATLDADGMVSSDLEARAGAGGVALLRVQPGLAVLAQDGPADRGGWFGGWWGGVKAPGSIALSGPSMAVKFAAGAARLVHVETDAPVVLRDETSGVPALFASGAAVDLFQGRGRSLNVEIYAVGGGDLSGRARFSTVAAIPITDGLGPAVRVGPGQSRLFSFSLTATRSIGVGVRGAVDDARCRLLASDGTVLGQGVVTMMALPPGTYFLAVDVPADGAATEIQPALVGRTLPDDGPPPDVQASYRALAGAAQD